MTDPFGAYDTPTHFYSGVTSNVERFGVNPRFSNQDFVQLSALVAELRNRVEILENRKVSNALWCDPGKHAFPDNDPELEIVSRTQKYQDPQFGTRERQVQVHICGEHIKKLDPFGEHADTQKVAELEAWNDGFEKGKEAQ